MSVISSYPYLYILVRHHVILGWARNDASISGGRLSIHCYSSHTYLAFEYAKLGCDTVVGVVPQVCSCELQVQTCAVHVVYLVQPVSPDTSGILDT